MRSLAQHAGQAAPICAASRASTHSALPEGPHCGSDRPIIIFGGNISPCQAVVLDGLICFTRNWADVWEIQKLGGSALARPPAACQRAGAAQLRHLPPHRALPPAGLLRGRRGDAQRADVSVANLDRHRNTDCGISRPLRQCLVVDLYPPCVAPEPLGMDPARTRPVHSGVVDGPCGGVAHRRGSARTSRLITTRSSSCSG